jgi:hypothetical protein
MFNRKKFLSLVKERWHLILRDGGEVEAGY